MSSGFQTLLSLLVVALAAAWLLRRTFGKKARSGCTSGECAALSPSVKKLKRKVHTR